MYKMHKTHKMYLDIIPTELIAMCASYLGIRQLFVLKLLTGRSEEQMIRYYNWSPLDYTYCLENDITSNSQLTVKVPHLWILESACRVTHIPLINKLLKDFDNPDSKYNIQYMLMLLACEYDNIQLLKYLAIVIDKDYFIHLLSSLKNIIVMSDSVKVVEYIDKLYQQFTEEYVKCLASESHAVESTRNPLDTPNTLLDDLNITASRMKIFDFKTQKLLNAALSSDSAQIIKWWLTVTNAGPERQCVLLQRACKMNKKKTIALFGEYNAVMSWYNNKIISDSQDQLLELVGVTLLNTIYQTIKK